MTAEEYLNSLDPDRREVLSMLRELILKHDKSVQEAVTGMMGREMLVYNVQGGILKYALSSVKSHMTWHSMVMYGGSDCAGGKGLREKFEKLLPMAKFQKGCINFKYAEQIPSEIAEQIIKESAAQEYPPAMYKERMLKSEARRQAAQKKRSKL